MAIRPTYKSPLDLNPDITIGITFPLMDDGQFIPSDTVKQQVKSNILNVLLTEPGERLFLPDFGVGLKGLLFENVTDTQGLRDRMEDQLGEYVPEIQIMDLDVFFDRDKATLSVKLTYAIQFENQIDSIQVNIAGSADGVDIYKSIGGF